MNNFIIAFVAALIRVLVNMQVAYKQSRDKGKTFSFSVYWNENKLESLIGVISALVFAFMSPAIREITGYGPAAEGLAAFGCGFSSLELLKFVQSFSTKKLTPIVLVLITVAGLSSCLSDRQKYNRIIKRNPAWLVTKVDTVVKTIYVNGIDSKGESDVDIDTSLLTKTIIDVLATYNNGNVTVSKDSTKATATKIASAVRSKAKKGGDFCIVEPIQIDNDSLFLRIELTKGKLLYDLRVKPKELKVPTVVSSTTMASKIDCDGSFKALWKNYLIAFFVGFFVATVLMYFSFIKK
jgi:hypothetical protein